MSQGLKGVVEAVRMVIVLLTCPLACEPHWATTYCPMPGKSRNATSGWTFEAMFASHSENVERVLHMMVVSSAAWL